MSTPTNNYLEPAYLKTARSFWVYDHQKPQVNVYCHKDDYQTNFHLMFNNVQAMNECVSQFMKTEMHANLFSVWNITPFVGMPADEKESNVEKCDASIEFTFGKEGERDYFEKYASPLFSDFTLTKGVKGENTFFAKLQSNKKDSEKNQIAKINDVFKRITESRFGGSRINHVLASLNDPRFPGKEYGPPSCMDKGWGQEHIRDYYVTENGITEKIHLISDIYASKPATQQEIESWVENPEAQKGQGKQRYQHYMKDHILNTALQEGNKDLQKLAGCAKYIPEFGQILQDVVREVLKEQPIDNKKLRALMIAAESVPNFNYAEALKQ